VYLKSLTLKGFKSFADPTTIELEPGITVVVGPNGSGKSNVVDAVAWVLGAQGPRVVRSARMDDVIFAGSAKRPALGRAEVSLTIDNASRRLPIDFTEVTVTRTLFRSGESEYAINGVPCRLLDVQELFSDTGVGRQQHVIVGQGQLDAVLQARPEERRMVIEEAAGVLKYRRRRERAERRLEASEASLARVQDLLREVRRQLKPLERQAEAARRHDELAAELRALRVHLAGRELLELAGRLEAARAEADETAAELERTEGELEALEARLATLEDALAEGDVDETSALLARLDRLGERARGLAALATERRRALAALSRAYEDAGGLRDLEAELAAVRAELVQVEADAASLEPEWQDLGRQEAALAEALEAHRLAEAEAGDLSTGETAARRAAASELRAELAGLREAQARTAERAGALAARADELAGLAEAARAALEALAPELDRAVAAEREASAQEASAAAGELEAAAALRGADEERLATRGRVEALEQALAEAHARAGLARLADAPGVLGTLVDLVEVDERALHAFEAAAEGVLDAVVVRDASAARAALERLRSTGASGAVVPLGGLAARRAPAGPPPPGTVALRGLVRGGDPALEALLDELLAGVCLCDAGFAAALEVAGRAPTWTVVTSEGDRFSPLGWRVGAGSAGATRAALEAARRRLEAATGRAREAAAAHERARERLERARRAASEATRHLDRLAAEQRRHLEALERSGELLAAVRAEEEAARAAQRSGEEAVAALSGRLAEAERGLAELEGLEEARLARARQAAEARRALDARVRALGALRRDLEVRAAALEERRSLLRAREAACVGQLAERSAERERAAARRDEHRRDDARLAALLSSLDALEARAGAARAVLAERHEAAVAALAARRQRLADLRAERARLEAALATARARRQRLEVEQTEARVRREAAVETLRRELGVEPDDALAAPCPELPEGTDAPGRCRALEAALAALGPVNPLAAEELAALGERHAFLESQLEDVRRARRELNEVIAAIDAEIVEAFAAAYRDVEANFAALVSTLFPGGTGRVHLTSPEDLLSTGVELEVRPAGRTVRRLSLLSGGERSLAALAFLFAVFRSRPSPFYLLDEVEAALDDVNLARFLALLEEFRAEAQLVIVSHQKKTMEIADALFGVSMQPGGSTKVVSERLRRPRGAPEVLEQAEVS